MTTAPIRTRLLARLFSLSLVLAILASLSQPASADDELGRLFFTPERRQALDRQRQSNVQEKQEFPEEPTLTINGVVTRSSGKRTVWINGVTQNENEAPSGVTVTLRRNAPGKVTVEISDIAREKASVGDTINRTTGESTDLLNGGEIRIKAKPSARK